MMNSVPAAGLRQQLARQERRWQQAFTVGEDVYSLQRRRTGFFDEHLHALLVGIGQTQHAIDPLACVAIGGYGRQALAPGSDLDLLFLTADTVGEACAKELLYRLWDAGIETTGVVRTVRVCAEQLRHGELRTQTALLDSRWIGGAPALWDAWQYAQRRVQASVRWQRRFVKNKLREQRERRARFGASPFFLEPNVKEGEGGLRDWHTIWWIGRATGRMERGEDFVRRGWLPPADWEELSTALAWLERVRWGLHTLAGRKQDRLGFEEQEALAQLFHLVPEAHERSAAAALMRRTYESVATIRVVADELLWRRTRPRVGVLVDWVRRRLHPSEGTTVAEVMACFATVARTGVGVDPERRFALRRLARTMTADPAAAIAWHPFRAVATAALVLRELQRTGWLERVFPEFRPLRALAQRDAYHCYTVDTHLIAAVGECSWLLTTAASDLPPGVAQARSRVQHAEDLLFATFYHDAGKGVGRSHAQTGAMLIERAALRLGWEPARIRTMQFLVRSHQLMATLAFTRDLHDDRLIAQFAETVGTVELLASLYLLTIADLRAVGPNVYTEWKRTLLYDLYARAEQVLTREGQTEAARAQLRAQRTRDISLLITVDHARTMTDAWVQGMPERYLRSVAPQDIARHVEMWYGHGEQPVSVLITTEASTQCQCDFLAADQLGIFAKFCGVLAAQGINIVEAQVYTGAHGYVLDRFFCVHRSPFSVAAQQAMVRALTDAVGANAPVDALLARRKGGRFGGAPRLVVPPQIAIDNTISEEYTVLDIRIPDRLGLLYAIAQTLYSAGYNILTAKIATIGGQVHDAFYVQDVEGGKVTDDVRLAALTTRLQGILGSE